MIFHVFISNLQFLSKLTEKAVAQQTLSHIVAHDLFPDLQSAYHRNCSTETALLRVRNDILFNMNRQHVTLLVFLDLNAAFDTIDHSTLLDRLRDKFGMDAHTERIVPSRLSLAVTDLDQWTFTMAFPRDRHCALVPFFSQFTPVRYLTL